MRLFRSLTLALVLGFLVVSTAHAVESTPFAKIDAALESGSIDAQDALLAKIQQVFAPEDMAPELRDDSMGMLRCATPLMVEWESLRGQLRPEVAAKIEASVNPTPDVREKRATYLSPGGFYEFTYVTAGGNAVSAVDTSPANGVPDYVERCAEYMDYSWTFEIGTLGFPAPPIGGGRYQVSFESIGAYGYTQSGAFPGGTRIVLHNTFVGFPSNTDPDGQVLGAAKVTCAHEFKHASQYAGSNWSEGGWLELDATWMEDIAYDATNDYYNYLPSGSPISAPASSLDAGGTGSYEDCVWQLYMSEVHTTQIITDLQTWRNTHQAEAMMTSYDQLLTDYGSSLANAWPEFTAWNYATGARSLPGFGYDEASAYPTSPLLATRSTYPANASGSVVKLAAGFVRATGIDNSTAGTLDVTFTRPSGAQVELSAVVTKTDNSVVFERLSFAPTGGDASLVTPLDEIADVGFIVSNSQNGGVSRAWTLEIREVPTLPVPSVQLSASSFSETLDPDTSMNTSFTITNSGEAGSVLDYQLYVLGEPVTGLPKSRPEVAKSVAGSTVEPVDGTYTPGTTANYLFTVTNQSPDDEWLTDVTLQFPTGVTVNGSTDFSGGTDGPLVTDQNTGDGVLVSWSDNNGGFGNIYGLGAQATATVNLSFDASLSGPLTVGYFIQGDIYGNTPHSVSGTFALELPTLELTLTAPSGAYLAIGESVDLTWGSGGLISDVKLELSRDDGANWEALFASTPNDGTESWVVTGPRAPLALFRVSTLDDAISSTSAETSNIYDTVPWLLAGPLTGSLVQGANATVFLSLDSTGLLAGLHGARIVIVHNGPTTPDEILLALNVTGSTAVPGAKVFALESNVPNPFNPATTIRFSMAQAGQAKLSVYDLAGRLVDVIHDGPASEGQHEVVWRGTDSQGRGVASGVYLYRLSTDRGEEQVKRMTLVR